jgi:hypothetical protein
MEDIYGLERQPNGTALLQKGPIKLKIRARKNPGPTKPIHFLVMILPAYRYLSSLYPVGEDRYTFDVDNKPYVLRLLKECARIEEGVMADYVAN